MYQRSVALICLLLFIVLLIPQSALPFVQEESIKERVRPYIESGVEYLKRSQTGSGAWQFNNPNAGVNDKDVIGATALAAIALMECNVPATDRSIKEAAKVVRAGTDNLNYNYSLCMAVLFFDRLHRGQPITHGDAGKIKAIAGALIRGQANDGGWGYTMGSAATDNSNTQFGIVALWVSRKYFPKATVNIDRALHKTEQKFRKSQREDGGWGYDPTQLSGFAFKSSGSMTCAGVLGLALFAGARQQQQDATFSGAGGTNSTGNVNNRLDLDPEIRKARDYIMGQLDSQIAGTVADIGASSHASYFFWSLERTATLLKWTKRNGFDWFEKGANYLISKQDKRSGSWSLSLIQGPVVDTSFILLFLAQSNLLGNLQETALGGGSLGDVATLPKNKKPDTKPLDNKEKAKALVDKLVSASPIQQTEILAELTDARGTEYTEALVDAINNRLTTKQSKENAREALANRMKRLTPKFLDEYTKDTDREFRLGAAVAIRLKNDTTAAGSLIPLLADPDTEVSSAALDSLKAISGQDFGKSVDRWSRWLDKVTPKKP